MKRLRVHLGTSVFGGTEDEEFHDPSRRLFERIARGDLLVLLSDETVRESGKAPQSVKAVWSSAMRAGKKAFDCVEMKRQAQRELMAEYEARRGEFSSYAEFLRVTAAEGPEIRQWRDRLRAAKARPPSGGTG